MGRAHERLHAGDASGKLDPVPWGALAEHLEETDDFAGIEAPGALLVVAPARGPVAVSLIVARCMVVVVGQHGPHHGSYRRQKQGRRTARLLALEVESGSLRGVHRFLFLTPETQERIAKVVAWAEQPDHWYRVGGGVPPGTLEEHVVMLQSYRCVYSHTVTSDGLHLRHLSISVPVAGRYPHPIVCQTLAAMFGFTGTKTEDDFVVEFPDDWVMAPNPEENCVVVLQSYDQNPQSLLH